MEIEYNPNMELTVAINEISNIDILNNKISMNFDYMQQKENLVEVTVGSEYKFRPEKLAYKYYGHDSMYPIILACNNLRTIFDFVPEELNNKVLLLKTDILKQILEI